MGRLANMPNSAMSPALVSRQRRSNSLQNSQREPQEAVAKLKWSTLQRKKAKLKSRRWSPSTTLLRVLRENSPVLLTIASLFAIPLPLLSPTLTLFAVPLLEPTLTAQSLSIARLVYRVPPQDAFLPASSGSSNSPLLSKVSSKPFPESILNSFAWTNTNLRRTRTHFSVVNSKLSGNSLPLSPKEMLPNVNATRSSTKTDPHPRVPVSNNCVRTLPNPS